MIIAWSIVIACVALAVWAVWAVRRMDNPPIIAVATASLGGGGAIGLIALPIAAAGNATNGGAIGAGLVLSAVAAALLWVWLPRSPGWTPPAYANETPAAEPVPVQRDVRTYRVRSAADAVAEAQAAGPARSARVRRIMDLEV